MANICTIVTGSGMDRYLGDDRCEKCKHVMAGEPAVAVHTETDTFGPVGWMAVCQACHTESQESLSFDPCHDCKQKVPEKDLRQWRWYDFYAPQGDEPLYICGKCWGEPRHQKRIARDRQEEEDEFGGRDDPNDSLWNY